MKYKLKKCNMVQETDSEERKKELLEKGFKEVDAEGRPKETESMEEALVGLVAENDKLHKRIGELERQMEEKKTDNIASESEAAGKINTENPKAGKAAK